MSLLPIEILPTEGLQILKEQVIVTEVTTQETELVVQDILTELKGEPIAPIGQTTIQTNKTTVNQIEEVHKPVLVVKHSKEQVAQRETLTTPILLKVILLAITDRVVAPTEVRRAIADRVAMQVEVRRVTVDQVAAQVVQEVLLEDDKIAL